MWAVACNSKCKKPLHHISINPFKDERLTDQQVLKIIARAEQKYGYKPDQHQRVIVEHVKDGRQHFHVMWNRVSLKTGKAIWPGEHWKKSKQVAREMEGELGLKRPIPKRFKRMFNRNVYAGMGYGKYGRQRSYNYSTGYKTGIHKTKPTWRMSKVGGFTSSYPLSSGRSGNISIGINRAGFSAGHGSNSLFLSWGINSFVKLPFRNPAWQTSVQSRITTTRSGSSIRYWHPRWSGSSGSSNASFGSYVTALYPASPSANPFGTNWQTSKAGQTEQPHPTPFRPAGSGSMCEAQRIDLEAAIAGKITWAEYFKKWGAVGLRL